MILIVDRIIIPIDYLTANDPTLTTPLNDTEKLDLYAELASGAETGWDYTVRFASQPFAGGTNNTNPILRSLGIRETIPICLNSILCTCLHYFKLTKLTHPEFTRQSARFTGESIFCSIYNLTKHQCEATCCLPHLSCKWLEGRDPRSILGPYQIGVLRLQSHFKCP